MTDRKKHRRGLPVSSQGATLEQVARVMFGLPMMREVEIRTTVHPQPGEAQDPSSADPLLRGARGVISGVPCAEYSEDGRARRRVSSLLPGGLSAENAPGSPVGARFGPGNSVPGHPVLVGPGA